MHLHRSLRSISLSPPIMRNRWRGRSRKECLSSYVERRPIPSDLAQFAFFLIHYLRYGKSLRCAVRPARDARARHKMVDNTEIRIAQDQENWATAAATLLYDVGRQAVENHGRFFLALSGGSTPERLYHRLVHAQSTDRFDWSHCTFFFSDERCVPPDHPDSNFGLANRTLFRPLNIETNHIHRMRGELSDPDLAARDYERLLRTVAGTMDGEWPQLDLVLLGLGNDGHTASLFPGTAAVDEHQRWVTVGHAPSDPRTRLTLTLGVINRATVVLFLVTGAAKAHILKTVLEPESDADRQLPSALVHPTSGRLIWLLDSPAAAELTGKGQGAHKRRS